MIDGEMNKQWYRNTLEYYSMQEKIKSSFVYNVERTGGSFVKVKIRR